MITEAELTLGEALVSSRLMKPEDLQKAIKQVEEKKSPNLMIQLLRSDILSFKIFQKFLSQNFKIRTAILAGKEIPEDLLKKMGWKFAQDNFVIPIMEKTVEGKRKLALGMVNPLDEKTVLHVSEVTEADVTPVLISLSDFDEASKKWIKITSTPPQTTTINVKEKKQSSPFPAIKKFREEIMVRLELDEFESQALGQDSYYPQDLISDLRKVKTTTMERNFEKLNSEEKFESLVQSLIIKGVISKDDLLISASLMRVFGGGKK